MKIKISEKAKKNIIITGIILLVTAIIVVIALYISNQDVRTFIDRNILKKEVLENDVVKIELNSQENTSIYAYYKYITLLNKNKLITYNSSGEKEFENEIQISNPTYASNNRFLVIAETKGQELYVVSESNILWQAQVEGEIEKVNVNKNGYVTIITSGTSYKTVVITYSPQGKELFKTYLSDTIAIKADISNDNKYLSIAEVNISGTLIQSNIKIIEIEKAKTDPTNSVIYTYKAEANQLITDIKYQDRDRLICMYDDSVHKLADEQDEKILDFSESEAVTVAVNLNDYIMYTVEKTINLISTNTQVVLMNINTQKQNVYTIDSTVKSIKAYGSNLAFNTGTEVQFISTNGWLQKKYISSQEIKDIVLADQLAAIVYKDKIEIVKL